MIAAPPPYPPATWRLLRTPPLSGAENMALDEALLRACAEGQSPPTLRLYAWDPPCLSLGYAQPVAEVDLARLKARGWGLVRRPTGGRAILHTDELTYSVIAPMEEPRVVGGVIESYRQLSAGLLRGLERLGLQARADRKTAGAAGPVNPVCFEVPSDYEITADGHKLLGSAQVRKKGVVLQHGTLPLTGDIARICEGLVFADEAERAAVQTRVRARAATVETVLGTAIVWEAAAEAIQQGFAEALNLRLAPGAPTALEQAYAQQLRVEKYAAEGWNQRL